jgi:hypothetical protein
VQNNKRENKRRKLRRTSWTVLHEIKIKGFLSSYCSCLSRLHCSESDGNEEPNKLYLSTHILKCEWHREMKSKDKKTRMSYTFAVPYCSLVIEPSRSWRININIDWNSEIWKLISHQRHSYASAPQNAKNWLSKFVILLCYRPDEFQERKVC